MGTFRRAKGDKCAQCLLHPNLCFCAAIDPWPVRTKVVVVQHHREQCKPSNSGRLVKLALEGAAVLHAQEPLGQYGDGACVLFPSPDAEVLEPSATVNTLIVPDGSWRQARRMQRRMEGLEHLPRVRLPPGGPGQYTLRHHPDADHICTLEAIARALGILEGDAVQVHLQTIVELLVDRVTRGRRGDTRPLNPA